MSNTKEDKKNRPYQGIYNFLGDEDFIRWRLFQTKESEDYWNDFLDKNPQQEEAFHDAVTQFNAVKINRNHLPEEEKLDVYAIIQLQIFRHKRHRLMRRIGSVAAVLTIGILSVFFFNNKGGNGLSDWRESESITGQTLPQEEIVLVSGGEKINIAHQSHIGLTGDGKALVTDSTNLKKELLLAATESNKLIVPFGKRTNLTLTDGTIVWLNSGTQLDFPSKFAGNKREILVNGEIFIDVAHNPRVPFIVHARDMDIHVYGTTFNVSAYNDDSKRTVVLVDGKVKIETADKQTAELLPNEKIEISDGELIKESVNVSEYISWTRGILEFEGTPVSEILKKIGRYYNVKFENSPDVELNDMSCSGKLFLSNNLDSVMTSVSVLSSTVYQRESNIIRITKK